MTASPSRAPSLIVCANVGSGCHGGERLLDERRDQSIERPLALRTARVALEEEPLDRPERRHRRPPPAHPNRRCRVGRQFAEPLVLIAFDCLDDRGQQPLARPEMVNQHAVTGADLRREVAQRPSGEPPLGGRLDDAAQQVVTPPGQLALTAAATLEVAATRSLCCFSPAASMAR